jgi:SAM-dependent methyltransferase
MNVQQCLLRPSWFLQRPKRHKVCTLSVTGAEQGNDMQLIRRSYDVVKNRTFAKLNRLVSFRSAIKKLASADTLTREEKALVYHVSARVHPNDTMYAISSDEEYLSAGLSALRCIQYSLNYSNKDYKVRTFLDFPCGYGRVLRFLRARFPDANVSVSDIDREAVDFCARVFAAIPEMSNRDFTSLSISRKFDLIWCGSLITHIDEAAATHLLRFFHDHLAPGGVCVFTTHGQRAADWIHKNLHTFGLTEDARQQLVSRFYESGYGYAGYTNRHGVGISLVSRARVRAIASSVGQWKELCYLEHGWDNLQDVYSFSKVG